MVTVKNDLVNLHTSYSYELKNVDKNKYTLNMFTYNNMVSIILEKKNVVLKTVCIRFKECTY